MEKPKFKPFDRCVEAMPGNLDKLNLIRSLHYAYDMEILLSDFIGEIDRQEGEKTCQIAHGEFFLKEWTPMLCSIVCVLCACPPSMGSRKRRISSEERIEARG